MNVQQVRDWYRARPGYWFRPKLYGLGAVPVTWQGWSSVIVLIALAVPIGRLAEQVNMVFLLLLVPLVGGFILLARAKTDGDWHWRWGADD